MGRSSSAKGRCGPASPSSARGARPGREPVFAGAHRLNGNGELTGLEWVRESGMLTTPIAITNTHSVGVVRDALVAASIDGDDASWSLPVVGETFDGLLNDINGFHVRAEHLHAGTRCRRRRPGRRRHGRWRHRDGLPRVQGRHRDGVARHRRGGRRLHGRRPRPGELRQAGLAADRWRAGRRGDPDRGGAEPVRRGRRDRARRRRRAPARSSWSSRRTPRSSPTSASGWPSERVSASPASAAPAGTRAATCSSPLPPATGCRRTFDDEHPSGLGTYDVRAVGDIVIDRLFDATIEATEEAIVNALVAATTVVGRDGNTAHALPHDRLREVMTANGR